MTTTTTYTKLKSGDWGLRVQGSAAAGQSVSVTTRAGATKTETIERVLWTGNGISLCAIRQRRSAYGGRGYSSASDRCRECRGPLVNASHHRAMGGLCGACAFDEYDC